MLILLSVILCAAFDWARGAGSDRIPKWMTELPWIVPYGLFLAYLLGAHTYWLMAAFALCWWGGNRVAWTNLIVAVMQDSRVENKLYLGPIGLPALPPVVSLFLRGVIWALPALVLFPWVPRVGLFIPLAGIAMVLPALCFKETQWAEMEATRGFLMGAAAFFAGSMV